MLPPLSVLQAHHASGKQLEVVMAAWLSSQLNA